MSFSESSTQFPPPGESAVAPDVPPLLPPRPLSMSFLESSIQFAPPGESAAEASTVCQDDQQPNAGARRHTIIANIPSSQWTNVNRVHSEDDLSGYQVLDDIDNAAVEIPMQKNLAYSGLVLANTHAQETSMSPCIQLTSSEQDISSSESSSEDYHVSIDSVRQQVQQRDNVGLFFRTGSLNHSAALTYSDTMHQDTPGVLVLGSEQQTEEQSIHTAESQHGDSDEQQSLLSHHNTDTEGTLPEHLSLLSETASQCTGSENQSYERVWGYERIHHCDIPLESLLHKSSKPEDN